MTKLLWDMSVLPHQRPLDVLSDSHQPCRSLALFLPSSQAHQTRAAQNNNITSPYTLLVMRTRRSSSSAPPSLRSLPVIGTASTPRFLRQHFDAHNARTESDRVGTAIQLLSQFHASPSSPRIDSVDKGLRIWDWIAQQQTDQGTLQQQLLQHATGWEIDDNTVNHLLLLSGHGHGQTLPIQHLRRRSVLRLYFSWNEWPWKLLSQSYDDLQVYDSDGTLRIRDLEPCDEHPRCNCSCQFIPTPAPYGKGLLDQLIAFNQTGVNLEAAKEHLRLAYLDRLHKPRSGVPSRWVLLALDVKQAKESYRK